MPEKGSAIIVKQTGDNTMQGKRRTDFGITPCKNIDLYRTSSKLQRPWNAQQDQ